MKHKYVAYIKIFEIPKRTLVVTVLLVLLTQAAGGGRISRPAKMKRVPVPEVEKERIAREIATNYGGGPFRQSLEIKESADFLLTPALLFQEAISDDVIITYPTE